MPKNNGFVIILAVFILVLSLSGFAVSSPVFYKGAEYFKVISSDPTEDSGSKVCAKLNKTCVGYTGETLDICKKFHPDAGAVTIVSGSKAGFYCNGQPQSGICATQGNSCDICPACNVNADCNTIISDFYREMYVQCSPADQIQKSDSIASSNVPAASSLNLWQRISLWFASLFGANRPKTQLTVFQINNVSAQVSAGHWACDFYQTNKKLVSCGVYKAANSFCEVALQSQYAVATHCNDKGLIMCENPCKTQPNQVIPKSCPFDNARARGNQAAPINNC